MNNVENRVVEMKFDNSQFEQAVAKTMDTLDKFKEKLNFEDTGKGFDKLGAATGRYTGILGSISSVVDSVADHFSNLSGVGSRVFETLTSAATGFITSGLNKLTSDIVQGGQSRAMNLEQAKFQLTGILGDAQEVNRVIYDDILPQLQGTPFSLDQAAVVMGQLAASGKTSSNEVQEATRAIAGAAAMTNSSFADMGRIFTKVAGNGRVMGDTLQEMSSRGLNAAADMAKVFDMTEEEVREAVTAGEVSYDMFVQTMDLLYGEQAQKSTTMYTGALEDLRAALARIGAEPQAVKLEFLRDAFNALVPAVDAVNAVLKPWVNSAHEVEEYLDENGETVTRYAKAFKGPLAQSIQQTGWAFQKLFVKLDENNDIMRYSEKNWKELGLTMEKDEEGVKHYYQTLKKANGEELKVEREFGEAVMNPNMYRIMTAAAESFVNVVAALGKVLKAVGEGILDAFPKLSLSNIAGLVEGIQDFTHSLILSEDTLQNIKFVVQAVFTPVGMLVRVFVTAAKVLAEFGKIVYHAVAPVLKTLFSMLGAAAGIFSGFGKAVDNAAADITGIAQRLYGAVKSFAEFLHLDKLVGHLKNGLEKLSSVFTKVGTKSYDFLAGLSENAKKAAAAIYQKLRLDEFAKKLTMIKDRLKAAVAATGGYLGFEKLVMVFNRLKEAIKKLFSSSFSLDKISQKIKGLGSHLLSMIPTDKILNALDKFADGLTKLIFAIASFVGPKIDAVIKFFYKIGDSIVRLFNTFKMFASVFGVVDTFKLALFGLSKIIPRLLGFKSFADILDTVKDKIAGFISAFRLFIKYVTGSATEKAALFGQNMKNGMSSFVDNKITGRIQKFSGVVKALGDALGKVAGGIGNKLKAFYQAIEEGDKKKMIASLSLLVIAFGYIKTISKIAKTVSTVNKTITIFKTIGDGISGLVSSFKKAAGAIRTISLMIGITTSLLIFAAALSLLGRMNMDTLVQGGIAAIGSLIALAISLAILDKVAGKTPEGATKIAKLGGAMAAVGAAVYLISKAMQNLASVYNSTDTAGYIAIVATMGGLLVAFGVLATAFSKMDKMEVSLKSAGLAMLAISTAIKMMVNSMAVIGAMDTGSLIKGGGAVVILLGLMTALSYVAGKNENVAKAASALATLTASLLLLSVALRIYASMDIGTFVHGLVFMAGTLAVLLGVMSLFKTVAGPKEAGGIIAIAAGVGILAAALLVLAAIPFGSLISSIGALVIVLVAIAGIMALFSAVGIGMIAVAGAFALLGVSMLFIGGGALALAAALSILVPLFMALSAAPKDLVQGGLDVLAMIAEGLKGIFFDLAKGVLAFGAAMLVAAVAAVILGAGIVLISSGLILAGFGLLSLAGGIAAISLTIQAFFGGEFLNSIGNTLRAFGESVVTGLTGIVDKVKGIFSKDKGKEATKDYLDGGKEAVDGSSKNMKESVDNVIDGMQESANAKKAEFAGTMTAFMESGGDGITRGSSNLTGALSDTMGQFKGIVGGESSDISNILGQIPGDAGAAINGNAGQYTNALRGMFDSGNSAITAGIDDTRKAAKDQSDAYSNTLGGSESLKNAKSAGKSMADSAKEPYSGIGSDFRSYGNYAATGFASGIRELAAQAAAEARAMVRNAKAAAKAEQDSNSPSKEFAKLGRWADQGYIKGLQSLSGDVSKAASSMVSGGIEAVTDAMSYIASAADMRFDFNPTITPVVDLANVDQSVNRVSSMFDSQFGIATQFGGMTAALASASFAESRNQNSNLDSINKLANKLDKMSDTMNSRSLNVYNTIDGTSDPSAFADELVRNFRLNARTV